jgi:hypothetical protein
MTVKNIPIFFLLTVLSPSSWGFDFTRISTGSWQKVSPAYNYGVYTPLGGAYQSRGWGTLRYNTVDKTVVFYEGYGPSDHGNYCIYTNALYVYDPLADRVTMPSLSDYYCAVGEPLVPMPGVTPATPMPRHTYSQFAYVPPFDSQNPRGFVFMAYGASGSCRHPYDMWKYSLSSGQWTQIANIPVQPPYPSCPPGILDENMIYNSLDRKLYLFTDKVNTYDVAADASASVVVTGSPGSRLGHGCFDPKRNRFAFFGEDSTANGSAPSQKITLFEVYPSSGEWRSVPVSGEWPPARNMANMEYNAVWDVYMLHGGQGLNDTWIYYPDDRIWKNVTPSSGLPPVGGYENNVTYDGAHDVLVRFDGSKGDMWLFRYGAEGPPTSLPTQPDRPRRLRNP